MRREGHSLTQQLAAHAGTLIEAPPVSLRADTIIMREMLRTRAPVKHSAPAMKTLEGSGETAWASSRGHRATSLPVCVVCVSCEAAEGAARSFLCLSVCSFPVYADIIIVQQMLCTDVSVKG